MNLIPTYTAAEKPWQLRLRLILNAVGFQFAWFSCIYGAAHGSDLLAILLGLALIGLHLLFNAQRLLEIRLILVSVTLGLMLDTFLSSAGLLSFTSAEPEVLKSVGLSPIWMWMLWALMGCTLNNALRWLHHRLWLASALGMVAGPASYYLGVRWGAAQWGSSAWADPSTSMLVLAVAWMMITPCLLLICRKLLATTR
jgi:hypothetical protein